MKFLKTIFAIASLILLIATANALTISVIPVIANDDSDLYCSTDSTPGAFVYKWYSDEGFEKLGQTLDDLETNPGENWTCKVFLPSNSRFDETYLGEVSRTILAGTTPPVNNIPTIPTIAFSPGPYRANSVIIANATSTDADNDNLTYEYRFERSGAILSNTDTLNCAGNCTKNDVIDVFARAYDPKDYSAWASVSLTILNSPPYNLTITYLPITVYSNSTVTANASSLDNDTGDLSLLTYTYQFYDLNKSLILKDFSAVSSYTFNQISENDTIRLNVRATDGTDITLGSVDFIVLPLSAIPVPQTPPYSYCSANSSNFPVEIVEIKNSGNIDGKEFSPLDEFKVKVSVKNNANTSKTVYVKAIIVYNNSEIKDTESPDSMKISSESTKTFELNMSIPLDLKEGSYSLYIKAYDDKNKTNCEQEIIPFYVKREPLLVSLKDAKFSPATVTCGEMLTFSGTLVNLGESDEEKVRINYEDDMKNKFTEIIDNLDWGTESKTVSFFVNIPQNSTDAKHKATIVLNYDYDSNNGKYNKNSLTTTYVFTVSGCKPSTAALADISIVPQQEKKEGFIDRVSRFANENWKSMLIIVEIIIVVLIVLKILLLYKFI